jgi:CHASE2 domain-containing sensor protein
MVRKFFKFDAIFITLMIFSFIGLLNQIRLNLHFLDPFNYGLKDYEITDIVFSQIKNRDTIPDQDILLINTAGISRDTLGMLLQKINRYQPDAIGIDLFFEKRKDPVKDSILAAALEATPNVVLACRLSDYNPQTDTFESVKGVHPYFAGSARLGYANFIANETRTVRIFSPSEKPLGSDPINAFSVEVAGLAEPGILEKLKERNNPTERINYIGNRKWFPRIPDYHLLLDPEVELHNVTGKVVLMGYLEEPTEAGSFPVDGFFTPMNKKYSGRTFPDMFGMSIHANIISMLKDGRYIYEVPKWLKWLLIVLYCHLNVLFIHWLYRRFDDIYHGVTRLLQLVEFIVIFFVIAFLFYYFNLKIDFSIGIFAMILAYDFVMIYEYFVLERIQLLKNVFRALKT